VENFFGIEPELAGWVIVMMIVIGLAYMLGEYVRVRRR
jgi:hypothetical protein